MKLKQSLCLSPKILLVSSQYSKQKYITSRSRNILQNMLHMYLYVTIVYSCIQIYLYFHVHKYAQPFITKQIEQRVPENTSKCICPFSKQFSLRRRFSTKLSESDEVGKHIIHYNKQQCEIEKNRALSFSTTERYKYHRYINCVT